MDSTANVIELIDQLDDNLDSLQESLKTILSKSLVEVASGYPALDRAKLYILVTYAIESSIFSFLRMTGTSAREHPVYRELERVKQYFHKIKLVETTAPKPAMRLDQAAAGRFIKAALASNNVTPAKNTAAVESRPMEQANGSSPSSSSNPKKRKLEGGVEESPISKASKLDAETSSSDSDNDDSQSTGPKGTPKAASTAVVTTYQDDANTPAEELNSSEEAARKAEVKRARRKRHKENVRARKASATEDASSEKANSTEPAKKKQKKEKKEKKSKKSKSKD